jgi:hypothetical protein
LILFLFFFFSLLPLQAQDDPNGEGGEDRQTEIADIQGEEKEEKKLEVAISAPEGRVNVPWTLSFLVDYPYPAGVTVYPPEIPEELTLEEVRTEPRLVSGADGKRRTRIAFTFTPHYSGVITFAPFTIITPQKRVSVEPITVVIRGGSPKKRAPYFVWNAPSSPLAIGEMSEISLRVFHWDEDRPFPHGVFHFEPTEQAILEEKPLSDADISRNTALLLTIIPLEGTEFVLPRSSFQREGYTFEIPPLRLAVSPRNFPKDSSQKEFSLPPLPEDAQIAKDKADHEGKKEKIVVNAPIFSKNIEKLAEDAEKLWDSGQKASALALIRKAERDHTVGFALIDARRALEIAAGLEPLYDEPWSPKNLCAALFFCILFGTAFVMVQSFLARKTVKTVPLLVALIALAVLFAGFARPFQPKEAVLRESPAFYAPETEAGISARFTEGQSVFARSISDDWIFVETPDKRSGWVKRESVIFF